MSTELLTKPAGPVPVHKTETTGGPGSAWDPLAADLRLAALENRGDCYPTATAWGDPAGEGGERSTWRFLHHDSDGEGNVGPADLTACRAAIEDLNANAREAALLPRGDRERVYKHLAAHLRDGGLEAPALDWRDGGQFPSEMRAFSLGETRLREPASPDRLPVLETYSTVWGSIDGDADGFEEVFYQGAFKKSIAEGDIPALDNHEFGLPLARTSVKRGEPGYLYLEEDSKGLYGEFEPTPTSYGRNLVTNVRAGVIKQMSFRFRSARDRWDYRREPPLREVFEAKLVEISPVTLAWYKETSITSRARYLAVLTDRATRGQLSDGDRVELGRLIEDIKRDIGGPAPSQGGHAEDDPAPGEGRNDPTGLERIRRHLIDRRIQTGG